MPTIEIFKKKVVKIGIFLKKYSAFRSDAYSYTKYLITVK